MKKFPLFFFVFCILCCSCSNKEKTTIEELNLHGDVKSIKTSIYHAEVKFGELQTGELVSHWYDYPLYYFYLPPYLFGGHSSISVRMFTKSGMIESLTEYDDEMDLEKKFIYTHQGCKINSMKEYDEDGDLTTAYEWQYDKKIDKLLYFIEYDKKGSLVETTEYKYDPKTNELLEEKTTDGENTEIRRTVYVRKEDDEKIYWIKYINGDKYSKGSYKEEYLRGKVVKITYYDEHGTVVDIYDYDKHGRIILRKEESAKNQTAFSYNKNGDVIMLDENNKGVYKFEYDKHNNWIKRIPLDENNKDVYKFEYEYDKHKNWIKRVTYKGIKPVFVEIREIEYY